MKNRKIAIIDEDKKILGELEEILAMSGYTPVPVINPLLAVDTVIQNNPDVILMELRMPRKNGFELTDMINRVFATRKVPIIAMSESYRNEFRWLLDFCGIKRWIKKPFQPLDLIWAIENEIEEGTQWEMEKRLAEMEMMA
jgi:DNA-binding response OmpR family regulator